MFYKVKKVEPMDNMLLRVKFFNNETKIYDVKPLVKKWEAFKILQDKEIFKLVKVDMEGYGIVWNDEVDLSCNELWENGISCDNN